MQYLLDTVAVIRHFTGSGKIGSKASLVFNNLENKENCFVISVISFMGLVRSVDKSQKKRA